MKPDLFLYHPLILLTVTSPWKGSGGYGGPHSAHVGSWAGDFLEAMYHVPVQYTRIRVPSFHETDEALVDLGPIIETVEGDCLEDFALSVLFDGGE